MRIAHVVTLLSKDNAFGGPLSVAKAQVSELNSRGHDVILVAGWDGLGDAQLGPGQTRLFDTRRIPGVPGFSGLVAPGLSTFVRRGGFDIVHVHLARDLITLPTAALSRAPLVLQTHGMVQPDGRFSARVVDRLLTRRTLERASAICVLTSNEMEGVGAVAQTPGANFIHLDNGVAAREPRRASSAQTVTFCARLHERKRVSAFIEMARALVARGMSDVEFVIAGPDEGDLPLVEAAIRKAATEKRSDGLNLEYRGALDSESVLRLLRESSVFVLPSFDEPFPITVLEALSVGTPTVITNGCGIGSRLEELGAAVVTDGSVEELSEQVYRVLNDERVSDELSKAGRQAIERVFSISRVVDELETIYCSVSKGHRPSP